MRRSVAFTSLSWGLCLAACGGGSNAPGPASVIASNQPGSLLSGWVEPDGTAYFVGGKNGGGGLLVRLRGDTLDTLDAGDAAGFWWITGTAAGEMWLSGERGQVHRFDGQTLTREDAGIPDDATLFGIWGTAADDLWTVGGGIQEGASKKVIAHKTGGAWTRVDSPAGVSDSAVYFKVWGSAPDRVFVVGRPGTALRWDGSALLRMEAPAVETYLTVHGCGGGQVYAVGGGSQGMLIASDGTGAFAPVAATPPTLDLLNGVLCLGADVYVGGFSAYAARVHEDAWQPIETPLGLRSLGIHGIAGRERGPVYAVGGDLFATGPEPRLGFVLRIDER